MSCPAPPFCFSPFYRIYSHLAIENFVNWILELLSAFRLVLAGVFAYIYWNAKDQQDYNIAVGVLVLSGLTDFADGKIARRFHMISELGKVLDPIADKLTQAVVACCLAKHYAPMKLLFLVLVIKELTQGIYGAYAVKKAGKNDGAMWCGKVTTFYLYAMMALLLLVSGIPVMVSSALISVGIVLLLWSFISYLLKFNQMVREAK